MVSGRLNGAGKLLKSNLAILTLVFALGGTWVATSDALQKNSDINAQQAAILDRLEERQRKDEEALDKEALKRHVRDWCLERGVPLDECPL